MALAQPEILASFPSGTFLENLEAQPDGGAIFTSYFDRKLLLWRPDGITTVAELPAHPTAIASLTDGLVVACHGQAFNSGADFTGSMSVLMLWPDGEVRQRVAVPHGRFLNGVARLDPETVLIADSLAGTIWICSSTDGTVLPWWRHECLLPPANAQGFALGANGVKLDGSDLYVSNSARRRLLYVRCGDAGPEAEPETVAEFSGIDDFAFDADGVFYVATHGTELLRRDPAGHIDVLADRYCEGATAVALGHGADEGFLFATTTGGFAAGLKQPAYLLRMRLP